MADKKHEIDVRDWIPVTELDGQILVNKVRGQLRMKGAAVRLEFPMLVVRHGETDGNIRYVLQGQVDGPENQLNRTGWKQARETACRVFTELENRLSRVRLLKLAEAKRMAVLTSPIQRAKETAKYFLQHFKERTGIELRQSEDDGLKEISFGQYDGCALEDIENEQIVAMVKR
ncbi:MAG: histidine phosphatase family protein, partial [bacterium]